MRKEQRKSGANRKCGKEEERRIDREQWKKENVLVVEVLDILPVIVEMWEKRNWYRCP